MSKEKFKEWVRKIREHVYELLNNLDDLTSYVSDEQPDMYSSDVNWVYEIDLDNLVFHVDNQPLFRLDNMPPDDTFMESISYDHFGHRALHEHTPTEFRYHWHAPLPSPLSESLVAYNCYNNRSSTRSVHDLMGVLSELSTERSIGAVIAPLRLHVLSVSVPSNGA